MPVLTLTSSGIISDCDATTGWTGDTFSLEPDIKTEGTDSVACTQTGNGTGTNEIWNTNAPNITGSHLRLSVNFTFIGNMAVTDPVYVFVDDGTNRDDVVVIASNAEYAGGWADLIIDTSLFTTASLSALNLIGFGVDTTSKPRNVPANTWVDNWRFSNGYEITSSASESFSFDNVATQDLVRVDGILRKVDGVLFSTGELVLGSTGSANCYVASTNEQIVFPDRLVDSTLYKIKTQEGTGTTSVSISGLVCKTVGGTGAELDFSANITSLIITGSTFINMGTIDFTGTISSSYAIDTNSFNSCSTTDISLSADSCTWTNCDQITITGTGELANCTIDSPTTTGGTPAVICLDLNDVLYCDFKRGTSSHAVGMANASLGSMSWTNTCIGYDTGTTGNNIANTGGSITGSEMIYISATTGTLTINVAAGATIPSVASAGAIVNVVAGQVDLTLNGIVQNSEVRIYDNNNTSGIESDDIELAGIENIGGSADPGDNGLTITGPDGNGKYSATYTYTYSAGTEVNIVIHHIDYEFYRLNDYTLASGDSSIPIQQISDRNYRNPV